MDSIDWERYQRVIKSKARQYFYIDKNHKGKRQKLSQYPGRFKTGFAVQPVILQSV